MELRPNEPLDLRMAKAVAAALRESKLPRDAFLQIQFLVKIQSDGQVQVSEMVATEHPRPARGGSDDGL